jgi:hypothetical protein
MRQTAAPLILLLGLALLLEPALANKFETISGGVNGSFRLKREFVQFGLLMGGGGFLIGAVLAVVIPRSNAALLNFANWRNSAIVMAVIGLSMLISYLFV